MKTELKLYKNDSGIILFFFYSGWDLKLRSLTFVVRYGNIDLSFNVSTPICYNCE